eukprot:6111325-Alexandrium_andersonii.AAC.1
MPPHQSRERYPGARLGARQCVGVGRPRGRPPRRPDRGALRGQSLGGAFDLRRGARPWAR